MKVAQTLRMPYPGYLWKVTRNTMMLWLILRLAVVVFLAFGFGEDPMTAFAQPSLGLPAVLAWLDRRRFREQLLTTNLAGSEFWFWATGVPVCIVLDLLVFSALSAV